MMNLKVKLSLLLILAIFVIHGVSLDFTQDDAYISYRYVRNFLSGHGLVFNPGERVEGYTNFLWIILLSVLANFGLDVIIASKVLGIASGCLALFLLYKISTLLDHSQDRRPSLWFFFLIPSLLLAINSAFAYWSISGLETTLFVMTVLLSAYFYFTNKRLMIIFSALSTLIRPEGALVFAIFILHSLFFRKKGLKRCLLYTLGFTLLLAPFLLFKIFYYGDLVPNPFYAKTGFSLEYVKTGLGYAWLFLKHYGLWGILFLLPIVFYKSLGRRWKLILLLVFVYTLYIVVIGGDVLQAHRFFMPIVPFLYLLVSFALKKLYLMPQKGSANRTISIFLVIAFSILTFFWPRGWIMNVRRAERALCSKMSIVAQNLRKSFGTDFTLAISTIGAISYFTEARVIDMLGLTDPYIAKHPEKIPGIQSIWKEKKFNTRYLLSQDPGVIMFSTGLKPSAPAERALFLSSKFRENYYPYYFPQGISLAVYRRKGDYLRENKIFPDARFVNLYNQALNLENRADFPAALAKFTEALAVSPEDFAWAYEAIGRCHYLLGNMKEAKRFALKAVEIDDYCMLAHLVLHKIYVKEGNTSAALEEKNKILSQNPQVMVMR
jgi:arabinofuranosyltransferase